MYFPWLEEDPYWFLGEKVEGQGQICYFEVCIVSTWWLDYLLTYNNDTSHMYCPWQEEDPYWFLVHLSRRLKYTIVITRCPSSVCPSLTFHIFDFSSETAERNSTKCDRKQDLNVLYQVCVFLADRKNKMAALASDWLRHFWLLLRNRWTEFNETLQEARSQCPVSSLCFSGWSEKQDSCPGLWLAETFSTSPLKPLNGIQWNLTGSKISMSSTKFVFFGPIRKTRWLSWPLIGWDIFDFSSETAERNSMKLYRKQDLNVLYQVCAFQADRKNKMAALSSDWLRHFRLLLWNHWTEFNEKISMSSTKFVFFLADQKTKMAPWLIPQKGGTLYSGVQHVALWASCWVKWLKKRSRSNLYFEVCIVSAWLLHYLLTYNNDTSHNYCPWQEEDPYWFLGEMVKKKGQGQICTLKFAWFPHDNSITFWHTIMILHTWVDHDPRSTSIDFGINRSKVKVKSRTLNFVPFHMVTPLPFDIQWQYFTHELIMTKGGHLFILGSIDERSR